MKITLFLMDRIKEFILPTQISGGFNFDEEAKEENKLINIEAKNDQWVMYSTDYVHILNGNAIASEVILKEYTYYVIRRNNTNYLTYVSPIYETNINTYTYTTNSHLIIGNTEDCNIKYNCPYLAGLKIDISYKNNALLLSRNNKVLIYINKAALGQDQYFIKMGDILTVCGLRIQFLPNILLINNPNRQVLINEINAAISIKTFIQDREYKNIEVKDINLYDDDSYFSKSPRIRRIIETKKLKIDAPPSNGNKEEMPLLYTLGPMLSMGIVSATMLISTISRLSSGETTMAQSWTQIVSGVAMLLSTLLWPLLTKHYNKKMQSKKEKETIEKYGEYLKIKEEELQAEQKLQKEILIENLITIPECINMIRNKNMYFWDKRIEQSDFLVTRIGMGKEKLDIDVSYPEEGFTIEESELKKKADEVVERYKYIEHVPVSYSFSKNKITAIMGNKTKSLYFVDNMILQLITFYSYDDLKLVLFTNDKNKEHWKYIKYLNHNFDNEKNIRFFSTNVEEMKKITDYLEGILSIRCNQDKVLTKPHYLIIIDDYSEVKKTNFIKVLTEIDEAFGFSLIIIEKSLSKLPSKCVNFIQLGEKESGVMENSYEKQEINNFTDEINYSVNMLEVSKILSNIPIEFENGIKQLPESMSFLEMEKIGKVEQLNVLNRWNTNDSTISLKAEIGVDENNDLMYLDLHEKFHGPHGLIAGTTGSGKSEFIITYILSLAINYSPDDVSFILIDYKGGGLALAFENKTAGIYLPHLAGTITNLDKAEMDRTLVSIDSEIKRRQRKFNEAREKLGESTIDIYKYQKNYKEGRLTEAIPHLFIICDEFAELKSQQPDFMDNLISVARIGRSLGVHLILATQKPSGVVNDQIWSNSKFKVCLKVQDAADSKEMLKRPDAANLKQAGRFYLQVGYDEYFALGQSAWCGAKYYPSKQIVKEVDKSLNFIDHTGGIIKSIQSGNNKTIESDGEQLQAILNNIIEVSKQTNKKSQRLWLPNIDEIILVDSLLDKYNYQTANKIEAILGEYDAPELQEQGLLKYDFLDQGNTMIYGNDSSEREMLLSSILYSTSILYKTKEINYYILDFGSEVLRKFDAMPQVGDIVYTGEDEKFKNLLKLVKKEISRRKRLFADFGGEYVNYKKAKKTNEILPIITIIINNYDALIEMYPNTTDDLIPIARDCSRYGIILIITTSSLTTVGRRLRQSFTNNYSLKLNDPSDYSIIFNSKKKTIPRDIFGRGLVNNGDLHEFQTASLLENTENEVQIIKQLGKKLEEVNKEYVVPKIPSLPEFVTFDLIKNSINNIKNIPIGITREELEIEEYDFSINPSTIISSNKLVNMNHFLKDLLKVFKNIKTINTILLDSMNQLEENKELVDQYINKDFDLEVEQLLNKVKKINEKTIESDHYIICIIYGAEKLKQKLTDVNLLAKFTEEIKKCDHFILIICDDGKKLKSLDYDNWFSTIKINTEGIWIGKGLSDQTVFRVSPITKEMSKPYKNNYGYVIKDSSAELIKVLDFEQNIKGDDSDE